MCRTRSAKKKIYSSIIVHDPFLTTKHEHPFRHMVRHILLNKSRSSPFEFVRLEVTTQPYPSFYSEVVHATRTRVSDNDV